MDDLTALEREISDELRREIGPLPGFDAMSIVRSVTATQSPKWRFKTMFSVAKFAAAGAIVALFGGFLLSTQPFDQQGSTVPGAATDTGRGAPVEVSGEMTLPCGSGRGKDSGLEVVAGVEQRRGGFCWSHSHTWSDPRLNGSITDAVNSDKYIEGSGPMVATRVLTIENAGGAWRMRPLVYVLDPAPSGPGPEGGMPDVLSGDTTWVFDGEGDYEGLVAVLRVEDPATPHGFIIDGELPPPPGSPEPFVEE